MLRADKDDEGRALFVHRTAIFDRSLEDLRRKGGAALQIAKKVDEVIRFIACKEGKYVRQKFRLTRNGEYRIRYCKKHDLGDGYRLVFLCKGHHLMFLYVGSHGDCFRWIENNKGLNYRIGDTTDAIRVPCDALSEHGSPSHDAPDEARLVDEYEAAIMSRINDDNVLRKIFSGLIRR